MERHSVNVYADLRRTARLSGGRSGLRIRVYWNSKQCRGIWDKNNRGPHRVSWENRSGSAISRPTQGGIRKNYVRLLQPDIWQIILKDVILSLQRNGGPRVILPNVTGVQSKPINCASVLVRFSPLVRLVFLARFHTREKYLLSYFTAEYSTYHHWWFISQRRSSVWRT